MAIVSYTGTASKGETLVYSLNKAALGAHLSVITNPYFSDVLNWKEVSVVMRSNIGNQTKVLLFNTDEAVPTANFVTSIYSRDEFLVDVLTLFDKERGQLKLRRSQLSVGAFDVLLDGTFYPPQTIEYLLQEDGARILTENGDFLALDA